MTHYRHSVIRAVGVLWVAGILLSCAPSHASTPDAWIESGLEAQVLSADQALPDIKAPAAVFVGEVHDDPAYHLNQLAVVAALRERGLGVAIGMEMIQTGFQQPLDDYVAGRIDFVDLLERTQYFQRWQYDPRLYQPIFEYARRHGLPLVALNAPRELTDRVSAVGIAGLSDEERASLPAELIPPSPRYRALLERVFKEHEEFGGMDLDRFIEVQRTWDEVMGAKSVEFLRDHPDLVLVVLAGMQHVAHGDGIPARLRNNAGLKDTIVLSENEREQMAGGADVFLDLKDVSLPASGRMGVFISNTDAGAVIAGFADNSPAHAAGAQKDDVVVAVDERPVARFEDIKLALWNKLAGDPVHLEVRRGASTAQMSFELY